MAKSSSGVYGTITFKPTRPKKTRQGCSTLTKLTATSRNGRKKKYRGQGK